MNMCVYWTVNFFRSILYIEKVIKFVKSAQAIHLFLHLVMNLRNIKIIDNLIYFFSNPYKMLPGFSNAILFMFKSLLALQFMKYF